MDPDLEASESIKRASVVIDCTPNGMGRENKAKFYNNFSQNVRGFIAQGSEENFGKKYAHGINDKILSPKDKFIQIVSCNTHNIACVTKTIALDDDPNNLIEGKYVCIRRANDISQTDNFIPLLKFLYMIVLKNGSHHARDAVSLFSTLGQNLNLFFIIDESKQSIYACYMV